MVLTAGGLILDPSACHSMASHPSTSFPDDPVGLTSTGPDIAEKAGGADASATYNAFRQYSWGATAPFQKLMRELWRYLQSFEDEHYQVYYKRQIDEQTLRDYSSAIQEIIPRMVKIQSIFNQNSRGFPDMFHSTLPTSKHLDVNNTIKDSSQDCEEFAILAQTAANKNAPMSNVTAGSLIQSALACQAAASKAAVALQRGKFGDPVCDPATVMSAGTDLGCVTAVALCANEQRRVFAKHFL